jgi:hypothetical protein
MRERLCAIALAIALAGGFYLAAAPIQAAEKIPTSCKLSADGSIKHIFYLQFDNVHFTRDNPNVPSDLEQMPHLLNFMESNGTLLTNHHTPLISHTSIDITTSLTGVYPDKFGVPVGNSFGLFNPDGSVSFVSSFTYWTDKIANGTPEMLDQRGKNAPAPWVPFTRAGCNFGAFSIANMELENVTNDVITVFGAGSPQAAEAASNPFQAATDFEGIAVHCARDSALCAANSQPDILPDEPKGYAGFNALFGNVSVQPQISPNGPVLDLDGNVIADANGHPGFPSQPGRFDPLATATLGYAAQMLENGVDVVYTYIEDAHDNHAGGNTFGPGEAGYVAQLQQYDVSFGKFFARLQADGITPANTLFIFTADEGDHYVGAGPTNPGCDGVTTPCIYNVATKGEINADLSRVLATEANDFVPFAVHSDDAPAAYIDANPGPTSLATRTLEKAFGSATGFNPFTGNTDQLTVAIADRDEMKILHMIPKDTARIPTFIPFEDPDYFLSASGSHSICNPIASCFVQSPSFAWNHGDIQPVITTTWLGMVGPGVQNLGQTGAIFSDHTDTRPTILALTGLKDDYTHEGRMLAEIMTSNSLPPPVAQQPAAFTQLAAVFKQINAPLGQLGVQTLSYATQGVLSSNSTYASVDVELKLLGQQRDALAAQIIAVLEGAEFNNQTLDPDTVQSLVNDANDLLASVPE